MDDDDNDEDLEAELAALQGRPVQKKKPQKKDGNLFYLSSEAYLMGRWKGSYNYFDLNIV